MQRTKNTADRILGQKGYTNPEALSAGISEQMRQKKVDEKDLIAEMTEIVKHELPRACDEVITATVLRRVYEAKISNNDLADKELTLRPDCKKTLKSVKVKVYHHNGKYEPNKFESGKMAWSCCMAKDKDAQGCVATIVDKQRWELSSFNN